MLSSQPARSLRLADMPEGAHVREVPILDDDYALGFEAADPSLQIDSWSPDDDFGHVGDLY